MENLKLLNNKNKDMVVNSKYLKDIEAINSKYIVSDEDLLNLKSGYDSYSDFGFKGLKKLVDTETINIINNYLNDDKGKAHAIRWYKRGLNLQLALRLGKLKGSNVSKIAVNKSSAKKTSTKKSSYHSNVSDFNPNISIYRDAVCEKDLLSNPDNYIILDTETTGLANKGVKDEIIQLSMINLYGDILYSGYFYPQKELHPEAAKINKLSKRKLLGNPLWVDEWSKISSILKGRILLAHNANFDMKLLHLTCSRYGIDIDFKIDALCTMNYLKELYGCESKKLAEAIRRSGIVSNKYKLHDALYDCKMLLRCLLKEPLSKDSSKIIDNKVCSINKVDIDIFDEVENEDWMLTPEEIENISPRVLNTRKTQKGTKLKVGVDQRCLDYIEFLNGCYEVTDEDLLELKTYGPDGVTRTTISEIESEMDHREVSLIRNVLKAKKDQDATIRWCKRGLKLELAIRKQEIYAINRQ